MCINSKLELIDHNWSFKNKQQGQLVTTSIHDMEDDWGCKGYKNKRGNERQHELKGGQKKDMYKGTRKTHEV